MLTSLSKAIPSLAADSESLVISDAETCIDTFIPGREAADCQFFTVDARVPVAWPQSAADSNIDLMQIGDRLISQACTKPAEVTLRKVANRYNPNVTDTIRKSQCGAVISEGYISELASNPDGLAMHAEVTQANALLPSYMNVGQSVSRLVATLGQPATLHDGTYSYNPNQSEDTVSFSVQDGHIKSVRWDWYIE